MASIDRANQRRRLAIEQNKMQNYVACRPGAEKQIHKIQQIKQQQGHKHYKQQDLSVTNCSGSVDVESP